MDIDWELDKINKTDLGKIYQLPRGCGKTQQMIDVLCDAVVEGQPKSWVWGHTHDFVVNNLKPRIIKALEERGLVVNQHADRIEVEGSTIIFSGVCDLYKRRGCRGFGDFVDHFIYDSNR